MEQPPPLSQPMQYGQPIVHNAPVPIMMSTHHPRTIVRENYHVKCVKGLSITQIILGILAAVLQIWDLIIRSDMSAVGAGLWTGVFFIIAGSLGVVSSNTRTTCAITSFMVMSIIACVFTIGLLTPGAISIGIATDEKEQRGYNYYQGYWSGKDETQANMTIAIGALLVIISVTEAIIAIISSCFACQVLCCTDVQRGTVLVQGQVQYVQGPNGQAQMVIVPVNTPPYQYTTPVGGFMTQPLSVPAGGTPPRLVHGMATTSMPIHPGAPAQPPTYSRQASPPPQYEQGKM